MKLIITLLSFTIILSSCAQSLPQTFTDVEIYGFWYGLLHGFIAPFTFIISLFDDSVAMYAVNNNGGWYNFGFLFGACIFFGGGSKAKKKK